MVAEQFWHIDLECEMLEFYKDFLNLQFYIYGSFFTKEGSWSTIHVSYG